MNPRRAPRNSIIATNGNEWQILLNGTYRTTAWEQVDAITDGLGRKDVGREQDADGPEPSEVPPKNDWSFIRRARDFGAALSPEVENDSLRLDLPGQQRLELAAALDEIDQRMGLGNASMKGHKIDVERAPFETPPPSYEPEHTYVSLPYRPMLERSTSTRSFWQHKDAPVTLSVVNGEVTGVRQLDESEVSSGLFAPLLVSLGDLTTWLKRSMWSLMSFAWLWTQPPESPAPDDDVRSVSAAFGSPRPPRPMSVIYVDAEGHARPVLMPTTRLLMRGKRRVGP